MPNTEITCFVSYAHDDADRDTLDYLLATLRDSLRDHVRLLVDQDVAPGHDFRHLHTAAWECTVALLVLTPAYKRRVRDRTGAISEEFTILLNRFLERDQNTSPVAMARSPRLPPYLEVLPVHLAGTRSDATPDEVSSIRPFDLTGLRVTRRPTGEYCIADRLVQTCASALKALADAIAAAASIGGPNEYLALSRTHYDELFLDLKARWTRVTALGRDYFDTQFVKTHTYKLVSTQQVHYLVGRKGAGKSTLTQVLPVLHADTYFATVPIDAERFNLDAAYDLYCEPQFRSDTSTTVSRLHAFEFAWEATLMLCVVDSTLGTALSAASVVGPGCLSALPALESYCRRIRAGHTDATTRPPSDAISCVDAGTYYTFCLNAISAFIRKCVHSARSDALYFFSDIHAAFTRQAFLNYLFADDVRAEFSSLMRSSTQKYLVTLDGFDNAFDRFRVETLRTGDESLLRSRAHFEGDWLASLLALTHTARRAPDHDFYSRLHFCMAIPMDRFLEVVNRERDSYRHWNRWFALQWSGVELSILVRKRLEGLIQDASALTPRTKSPQARLQQLMSHKQFRHLPQELSFEFNGQTYRMDLFLYVLRHTFWRPRSVLVYFASLLSLADNLKKWGNDVTVDAVRKCVKATTRKVISSEFVNELRTTVVNIEQILCAFRHAPIVLGFSEVRHRTSGSDYRFATRHLCHTDTVDKIRFLYDIGFLGLRLSKQQMADLGVWHRDAFQFNEGPTVFGDEFLEEEDLAAYQYVIHPAFSEYLRLNTENTEMVLVFDWDYLRKAEAALLARQGI